MSRGPGRYRSARQGFSESGAFGHSPRAPSAVVGLARLGVAVLVEGVGIGRVVLANLLGIGLGCRVGAVEVPKRRPRGGGRLVLRPVVLRLGVTEGVLARLTVPVGVEAVGVGGGAL